MSTALVGNTDQDLSWLPQDYDTLHARYKGYVGSVLWHLNKVPDHYKDLENHIWLKLTEARILEKFQVALRTRIPRVVTALTACKMLGIKFGQWRSRQCSYRHGKTVTGSGGAKRWWAKWCPDPVDAEGNPIAGAVGWSGQHSLFLTVDILALKNKNGFAKIHHAPVDVATFAGVTQKDWERYLSSAVHNHFANWCRHRTRKKDDVLYKGHPHHHEDDHKDLSWVEGYTADRSKPILIAYFGAPKMGTEQMLEVKRYCLILHRHLGDKAPEVIAKLTDGVDLVCALRGVNRAARQRVLKAFGRHHPELGAVRYKAGV